MSLLKELENEEKVIQQQMDQLKARLEAIQLLKGQGKISPTPKDAEQHYIKNESGKLLAYPSEYSSNLVLIQKIYICIKTLGSANVHDIAAQLKKFDSKEYKDKDFAQKAAANGVFKLNQTGVLKTTKQGRSVFYSIK